jgi:hypothetical protein
MSLCNADLKLRVSLLEKVTILNIWWGYLITSFINQNTSMKITSSTKVLFRLFAYNFYKNTDCSVLKSKYIYCKLNAFPFTCKISYILWYAVPSHNNLKLCSEKDSGAKSRQHFGVNVIPWNFHSTCRL